MKFNRDFCTEKYFVTYLCVYFLFFVVNVAKTIDFLYISLTGLSDSLPPLKLNLIHEADYLSRDFLAMISLNARERLD